MAILIPNMDVPDNCIQCPCQQNRSKCVITNKGLIFNENGEYLPSTGIDPYKMRLPDCPLVQVDIDVMLFTMVVDYCKSHTIVEFAEMNKMYEERKPKHGD